MAGTLLVGPAITTSMFTSTIEVVAILTFMSAMSVIRVIEIAMATVIIILTE